jgi:hypothetical protein
MATLEALEHQRIILVRCKSMLFMLVKEPVIHCSILHIFLARLPLSKANLRNIQLRIFSLPFLDEGGI